MRAAKLLVPAVAVVVALTAVLLADFAASRVWPPSGAAAIDKPYIARDHGWYELQPDFSGVDQFGPYIYPVATDADGFRRDPQAPPLEVADTIVLGDSYAYGMNGAWEDTFVGMFARGSARRVINAGVSSYSPTAYLHQYRKALAAGRLARGHVVVVAVDVSDVQDEAGIWTDGEAHPVKRNAVPTTVDPGSPLARRYGALLAPGVRVHAAGMDVVDLKAALIDRLPYTWRIYRYLRYDLLGWDRTSLLDHPRSAFTYADWRVLDATPPMTGYAPLGVRGGLDRLAQKLREIMALAAAQDARVYLLIYPWPAQVVKPDRFSWSAFIDGVCRSGPCAGVIDAIPVFRRLAEADPNWQRTYFVSGDTHFTPDGNRVVAEALQAGLPR